MLAMMYFCENDKNGDILDNYEERGSEQGELIKCS